MSDARRIGTLSMVTVGSTQVWSSTRRHGVSDEPVGGVVVSIDEHVDPETGEVARSYVTLDPFRTRPEITVHTIDEDEVTQQGVEPVDTARLVGLIRRLSEELFRPYEGRAGGKSKANKTGTASMLTTVGGRYIGWSQVMAAVVLGGRVRTTPAGPPPEPVDDALEESRRDFVAAAAGLSAQDIAEVLERVTGGRYDATEGRPWKAGLAMVTADEMPAAMAGLRAAKVTA